MLKDLDDSRCCGACCAAAGRQRSIRPKPKRNGGWRRRWRSQVHGGGAKFSGGKVYGGGPSSTAARSTAAVQRPSTMAATVTRATSIARYHKHRFVRRSAGLLRLQQLRLRRIRQLLLAAAPGTRQRQQLLVEPLLRLHRRLLLTDAGRGQAPGACPPGRLQPRLVDRHVVARRRPAVERERPDQDVVVELLQHLHGPAGHAADREDRHEQVLRDAGAGSR